MPPTTPPVLPDSLLVAGATGLIGQQLLAAAGSFAGTGPTHLHALARRPPPPPAAGAAALAVEWHRVDFAHLPPLPRAAWALCALGTTIAAAGSQQAFRAVDFDAVLAFAHAARAAGVTRLAVVSSLGASARSGNFYSRVKGEMEAALTACGFDSLVIVRPSLLAGDRASLGQPSRRGERLALALTAPLAGLIPAAWRPIGAAVVARAMIIALADGRPGVRVIESAELQRMGRAAD